MSRLWLAAIVVLIADQLTKRFVMHVLLPNESVPAIPHVLWWTYVQNTHGAFGLFGDNAVLLVVMALVVLGVFWFAFRDAARQSQLVQLAFGAIIGGAIGNIVDRVHFHFVVDFIDLRWWPVFNIADSCISIGVVTLVVLSLRTESLRRHAGG
jgi:signal peptidase II